MSKYQPSDNDIVRCRLRTLGMQEYEIHFDSRSSNGASRLLESARIVCFSAPNTQLKSWSDGLLNPDFGKKWIIYDVGGTRTNVRLPFFSAICSHY